MVETMSADKKRAGDAIKGDGNADRISKLPEYIIQHIQSFLPLKDAARTCILSKTWNRVCNLYPILCFNHNLFKSQFLRERITADDNQNHDNEAQIDETITNKFMDHVDHHLLRVIQQKSPIRKLTLDWSMTEDDSIKCLPRVDQWIELVNQAACVKELSISVRAKKRLDKHAWGLFTLRRVRSTHNFIRYKLQQFRVFATKGLQCLTLHLCEFGTTSDDDKTELNNNIMAGLTFASSLKQLHLSDVRIHENALHSLARCCPVIEILEFEYCYVEAKIFELSNFAKSLKKVSLYRTDYNTGTLDIRGTNLESFKCESSMACEIDKSACTLIRELVLGERATGWEKCDLFQDIATTFPLLEEAQIKRKFLPSSVERFRVAKHHHLRTLQIMLDDPDFKELYLIDCPNLTRLAYRGDGLKEVYIDCPNLREFCYSGTTIPTVFLINLSAPLDTMNLAIESSEDPLNTLWFVQLREVIQHISPRTSCIKFHIISRTVTFNYEELESSQVFMQGGSIVNLTVGMRQDINVQNQAALVDGMLWSIRPATLTISGKCYDFVKHLCDKLSDNSKEPSCEKGFCSKHWWHHIKDFEVETESFHLLNKIPDIKGNLPAFVELYHTYIPSCCFRFNWCS